MARTSSRRHFLKTTALAGTGFWVSTRALAQSDSPNEKLDVAVIGIEGQGRWNVEQLASVGVNLVALCDVDEKRTAEIRGRFPKADFVTDYRRLLDKHSVDAVLVATPDHSHAAAAMMALKAGKHVYCEKPLSHTVDEARALAQTAAKLKRVTQLGTQIHATGNYRRVVELIQKGAIGPVTEAHVWVERQWAGSDRPKDTPPVPEGLHWDLWVGPAPMRPYHPTYVPGNWRGWWDFGGGTLADMACHYMDLPFWALELRHPKKIATEGPPLHPESCPPWLIVRYDFPARKSLPPVKLTWYHGGKRPTLFAEGKLPQWGDGVLFVGEKGMLLCDYDRRVLLPEKDFKDFKAPDPFIPDSVGHHREWVEACKTGGKTSCNFDYSGALTETVLLGNVAFRTGKELEWDAAALKATNAPEADKFIRHAYREGWTL